MKAADLQGSSWLYMSAELGKIQNWRINQSINQSVYLSIFIHFLFPTFLCLKITLILSYIQVFQDRENPGS